MAERRMFSKSIVMSDAFLDLPMSSRCLYFTLGMYGDDDGFVNSPKSIMRQIGATVDDLKVLLAKKFVYAFDNGVVVIKHWRINNLLRRDRHRDTNYQEELKMLSIDENGAYTRSDNQLTTNCQPTADIIGKPSIGKDSIGKDSIENTASCDAMFNTFWNEYPKKVDKKRAYSAFKKLNPSEELFNTIINSLKEQKASDQWVRGFVPHPTTWLNGERWNDDIPKAPQTPAKKYADYMQREPVKNERFGMEYLLERDEDE